MHIHNNIISHYLQGHDGIHAKDLYYALILRAHTQFNPLRSSVVLFLFVYEV